MPKKRFISYAFGIICAAAILTSVKVPAYAAKPDSKGIEKGILPAASTYIDKSLYTDGSQYENEEAGVETVKIGLRYGDNAVSTAYISNVNGKGFLIGFYNEKREFEQLYSCSDSYISVSCGTSWHILIDGSYTDFNKAQNVAASYGGFVSVIDGEYRVLFGHFGSRDAAEARRELFRLKGEAYSSGKNGLLLSGKRPILLVDDPRGIALEPISDGKPAFNFEGYAYYGGLRCTACGEYGINVVNYLGLEDYIKGVIPYEMSAYWPYEALKAQAVCARTYVVFNQNSYEEYDFDLTDDTESQVYRGYVDADQITDSAVDETAGQYVRYQGEICDIYYFASSGGATEDGINVFGVNEPYLSGKTDPFEDAVDYNIKDWTSYRSGDGISQQLAQEGYSIGSVTKLVPEYSANGNVTAMTYIDKNGNELKLKGRDAYSFIRMNNCRFTIQQDNGSFSFAGDGWGHNCGMSQWGANAMAGVYGYDYEDIIRFYFTGAYIG